MNRINLLLAGLLIFLGVTSFAQAIKFSERIDIISPYEPTLSDAFKVVLNPEIVDTSNERPVLNYTVLSKPYKQLHYQVEPIKPAKVTPEPLSKLYHHYLKFGYGNYNMPLAEYYYNSLRSKKGFVGAHLKHHSAGGGIKDYAYSGFSENLAEVYGQRITGKHTIGATIDLARDVVHRYGFLESESAPYENEDIRQQYTDLGVKINLESNRLDTSALKHHLTLDRHLLADYGSTKEGRLLLNGGLQKDVTWFEFSKSQTIGIEAAVETYNMNDSVKTADNGLVRLVPGIRTRLNQVYVNLGLLTSMELDTVSNIRAFPKIDVRVNLSNQILFAYAGISGRDLKRNSFRRLTQENPFVGSVLPVGFSLINMHVYGGVTGSYSSRVSFDVGMVTTSISNSPLFVTDTSSQYHNRFGVVYDDVEIVKLKGSLSYQDGEKMLVLLQANFNGYSLSRELKAWHMPNLEASLIVHYNLRDKIILTGNVGLRGKSYAKTYDELGYATLKGYADIGLGIEYRYSKLISAFARCNNLTATRYYKWYNYPSYGFNALAGITLGF